MISREGVEELIHAVVGLKGVLQPLGEEGACDDAKRAATVGAARERLAWIQGFLEGALTSQEGTA